jgi:hypothetical protein
MDRTVESGMPQYDLGYTGFGCGLFDLELDGDLDLVVVNGHVMIDDPRRDAAFWQRYAQPNLLLRNDGAGRFVDAAAEAGLFASRLEVSRGLALGDLDRDGDLDVVISNIGNGLRVYRNVAPAAGVHWLGVRALTGKRDALGARVTLVAGDRHRTASLLANSSYLSAGEPRVYFGLGTLDAVDHVDLIWPDGRRERFGGIEIDRTVELLQGSGTAP